MNNTDKALYVAKAHLITEEGTIPPMIIGIDQYGKCLALMGLFRDFQEQITFCTIAKMAFHIHRVSEFFVLTHGTMQDTVHNIVTSSKRESKLLSFVKGDNKTPKVKDNSEVVILTRISSTARECIVYNVVRTPKGKFKNLERSSAFVSGDLIEGMFTDLLPHKQVKFPDKVVTQLNEMIENIRYITPDIDLNKNVGISTDKLKEKWESRKKNGRNSKK